MWQSSNELLLLPIEKSLQSNRDEHKVGDPEKSENEFTMGRGRSLPDLCHGSVAEAHQQINRNVAKFKRTPPTPDSKINLAVIRIESQKHQPRHYQDRQPNKTIYLNLSSNLYEQLTQH